MRMKICLNYLCYIVYFIKIVSSKIELCSQVQEQIVNKNELIEIYHDSNVSSESGCWCYMEPLKTGDLEVQIFGFQTYYPYCKSVITFLLGFDDKKSRTRSKKVNKCLHNWTELKVKLEFDEIKFVKISYNNNKTTVIDNFKFFFNFEENNSLLTCNSPLSLNSSDVGILASSGFEVPTEVQIENEGVPTNAIVWSVISILIVLLIIAIGSFLLRKKCRVPQFSNHQKTNKTTGPSSDSYSQNERKYENPYSTLGELVTVGTAPTLFPTKLVDKSNVVFDTKNNNTSNINNDKTSPCGPYIIMNSPPIQSSEYILPNSNDVDEQPGMKTWDDNYY